MNKIDVKSLSMNELSEYIKSIEEPSFRAKQIYKWLQQDGAESFDEMTNLSKSLRLKLNESCYIACAIAEKIQTSKLDDTKKYLFKLHDGEYIESVCMNYHYGRTICISSQVGCKMNCSFCATGRSGFSRNLTAGEMIAQIQSVQKDIGQRISNVVLMGMGEPLDNYDNVMKFLNLVTSDDGLNIGMRHISLSTCGIVDNILRLADKKLQLTLSVSLHAPNDEIRSKTMPVNKKWNIEKLLNACNYYENKTKRRISFEYALIKGINDSDENIRELGNKLKGTLCHVNLIPVNDVTGTGYKKTSLLRQKEIVDLLQSMNITATIRRTLGSDIDASCGQLKRQAEKEGIL